MTKIDLHETPRKFPRPISTRASALTINFERTTAMAITASFSRAPAC